MLLSVEVDKTCPFNQVKVQSEFSLLYSSCSSNINLLITKWSVGGLYLKGTKSVRRFKPPKY